MPREIIVPVQCLRGIAASTVAIGHILEAARGYTSNLTPGIGLYISAIGGSGVDIFFVISGFMMVFIAGEESGKLASARVFLVRRLLRVVPLYIFYTLVYFCLISFLYGKMPHVPDRSWVELLRSISFSSYQGFPVLEVGWTLMYEVHFYVLFALTTWLLPRRVRCAFIVILLFVLAASGMLYPATIPGTVFIKGSAFMAFVRNPVVMEFALGVIIGEMYLSGLLLKGRWPQLCMLAGALLILASGFVLAPDMLLHWRQFVWGLPSFLLLLGAVSVGDINRWPVMRQLGDISYSIYLAHPLVMLLVTWLAISISDGYTRQVLIVTGCILSTCLVSQWSYSILEQRFGKWLRHYLGY